MSTLAGSAAISISSPVAGLCLFRFFCACRLSWDSRRLRHEGGYRSPDRQFLSRAPRSNLWRARLHNRSFTEPAMPAARIPGRADSQLSEPLNGQLRRERPLALGHLLLVRKPRRLKELHLLLGLLRVRLPGLLSSSPSLHDRRSRR